MTLGTLYGVGVGPGDPELLTFKAARVLREVDVVFASAQKKSGRSLSLEIAQPHLREGATVIPLEFEHTFGGLENGDTHRDNARRVVEVLESGRSAAFLTLGDPMTYSTFTYLLTRVRELRADLPVQVIPGVTSFAAAAAAAVEPLAEGDEGLTIVSASRDTTALRAALGRDENLVVMKAFRNIPAVCDALDAAGLGERTVFSADCSRPEEVTVRGTAAVRELGRRYMSLFLVRRPRRAAPGK